MAKNKDIHKTLKSLSTAWENAEPTTAGFNVPDNDYVAKLSEMEIGFSKNGRLQVVSTFEIADGKMKGKEIKKFDGIDSDVGISFFKGYCEVIGLEYPEDIDELPDAIESFVDDCNDLMNLSVKTKDDFQNITVKGLSEYEIEETDEDDAGEDSEEEESDDDSEEDDDDNNDETEEEEDKPKSKKKLKEKIIDKKKKKDNN